ncbi:MAG: hypothetical protein ACKOEV_04035, partial [Cytophagales bacterium]
LRESLSKAYSSILESTKILSGIGFLAVENKAGQINGVELPKFDGFFYSLLFFLAQRDNTLFVFLRGYFTGRFPFCF